MATFSNPSADTSTIVNASSSTVNRTWDAATETWAEATGTWNNPTVSPMNSSTDASVITNATRN